MAPPSASPRVNPRPKRAAQRSENFSEEHKVIINLSTTHSAPLAKSDQELAQVFRSDLQGIRALITCTICDQLLYEPWTLACGHTYCYTCLCNWFVPNKRKKTCPDCRTLVKQMPAPAFLIKQMTDIFINRAELMPADETTDQHRERRKSETDAVEKDRSCDSGLFKGCFKQAQGRLQFNEEDHMYRCSVCSHEYIGGPTCLNCGVDFSADEELLEIDDFSDADIEQSLDGFDYHDYDAEVDGETDEDDAGLEELDGAMQGGGLWDIPNSPQSNPSNQDEIRRWGPMRFASSGSDISDEEDDEEESESLRDFIVDDEAHPLGPELQRSPSNISRVSLSSRDQDGVNEEDDYDEGGEVSSGRRRPLRRWATPSPSVVTVTDSATTSDAGDLAEEVRRLEESGWSPLEQEQDSDDGEHRPFVTRDRSDGSDTETTVGNHASDEEDDDRHRQNNSSIPPWVSYRATNTYFNERNRGHSVQSHTTDDPSGTDAYDSDLQGTNITDREGDVEMSVSPVSSRRSSATNSTVDRRPRGSIEILGSANAIHEIEDESSDGTILPAARRRRAPRYFRHSQTPEYDPRISMMFAQHQLDLRDVTARQSPYFEPASRSRNATSYRLLPPRAPSSSSSAQPSSAVILTSVSNRPNRVQRQYPRRYYN